MLKRSFAATALVLAASAPALAVESSMQIVLELSGNAQRDVISYECEGTPEPLTVEYVNAAPTFLAFVPVNGEKLLFVNVLAASGARYASGNYEWSTNGSEATLIDLTAEEGAPPMATCLEHSLTP